MSFVSPLPTNLSTAVRTIISYHSNLQHIRPMAQAITMTEQSSDRCALSVPTVTSNTRTVSAPTVQILRTHTHTHTDYILSGKAAQRWQAPWQ